MKYRLDIKKGYVEWFPLSSDQSSTIKLLLRIWGVVGLFMVVLGLVMVGLGWMLFAPAPWLLGW